MKRKHSTETPVCSQERLVIISYTTGLSFALERIGPLAAIIIIVFYLFVLYLLALPNTPKNRLLVFTVNSWSNPLVNTFCSLLGSTLLFIESTTIHPPILVGHQCPCHPKKYPRSTSIKAWGCPRHPLLQETIFLLLHMLCVFLGASLFFLSVFFCLL
jgi:hypothetical protein